MHAFRYKCAKHCQRWLHGRRWKCTRRRDLPGYGSGGCKGLFRHHGRSICKMFGHAWADMCLGSADAGTLRGVVSTTRRSAGQFSDDGLSLAERIQHDSKRKGCGSAVARLPQSNDMETKEPVHSSAVGLECPPMDKNMTLLLEPPFCLSLPRPR